jgi:hypothetical protein
VMLGNANPASTLSEGVGVEVELDAWMAE